MLKSAISLNFNQDTVTIYKFRLLQCDNPLFMTSTGFKRDFP